ncbi:replication initiation protein [Virgibacillus salexigens]|uniref:Replication protein n=1 Tax=Virgibacillus massiliensis TaxID=1462526 RepID=A0A024QHH6_9BACI|nr:replication initiation protein [Virgibacillus massiliensis]CDQ41944.1 replication protein [Virgibacillus massiliensis]
MTEPIKKDIEKKIQVYQSNDLVEAIYEDDLTATEHKIIRYAAGKIVKSPEHFPNVSFTVSEFVNAAGLSGNSYYSRVNKIAGELTKKRIMIKTESEVGWFPWFKGIVYRGGMVHIQFNEVIEPYLINLTERGRYTKYDFPTIGEMQSPYTIRLFELLQQYAKIGRRTFKLDKLKEHLGVGDKYKQYGHFKSRVLLKAQEELKDINVLTFEFEEVKHGRKVDQIEFDIKITDTIPMDENVKEDEIKNFLKEARPLLKEYGYDIPNRVIKTWTIYGIDELKYVLQDIYAKNRSISRIDAYITTILKSRKNEFEKSTRHLNADNYLTKKRIMEFIEQQKTSEVLPSWWVHKNFIDQMESYDYTEEEATTIWEKNSDHIMQATKL